MIRSLNMLTVLLAALALAGCEGANERMADQFGWEWRKNEGGGYDLRPVDQAKRANEISSENPDDRRRAVIRLCDPERAMPDKVVSLLATIIKQDPDPTVRAAAARALGFSPNAAAIEPLVEATNDRNEFVRLDAVRGLAGKNGDNVKRALLVRLARDTEPQIRSSAADGLGEYHDRRVLDSLINGLRDPDFAVVYMCEQSLEEMTGQSFDYDPDAWNRWVSGLGPEGDPFARAGQTPAGRQQGERPLAERMRDAMHHAWFWWQADEKPK